MIRSRFDTNSYWTTHITTDPTSSEPLTITFTPTLTPDYQLKYGFNNIARIEITHLMQNKHIEAIYITAGSEVTFLTSYCNATLESDSSEATPYPYRFECSSIGSRSLKLIKQNNFPEWTSAFLNKKVVIYLKYTIANWKTGTSYQWKAYAYTAYTGSSSVDNRHKIS